MTSRIAYTLKEFGGLALVGPTGTVVAGVGAQRRSLALLATIAAARERGATRAKLVGLLWGGSDEERARGALAQTIYRVRQALGADAITGSDQLRLNPEIIVAEAAEFDDAFDRGELERAVRLYAGPFLDGFYLPNAPELEQWIDEERSRLAHRHREALERLATGASARGAHAEAAGWWRALAAVDPLSSRVAARLVEALAASGDVGGALQAARVHEALIREELDAAPDACFAAAVARVRERVCATPSPIPPAPAALPGASESGATGPAGAELAPPATREEPPGPRRAPGRVRGRLLSWRVRGWTASAPGVLALAVTAAAFAPALARHDTSARTTVAVGEITDFTGGAGTAARTLPELLTANLGRVDGLEVVSRGWLYDVATQLGDEPNAQGLTRAAQRIGAHTLVDGALYRRPDGTLRFQVRLLDLERGILLHAHQFEGDDPFALADSATAPLAADLGIRLPGTLRVTDVTTHSLVALAMYEEGLRAYYRGDGPTAERLFSAALDADSTFAMAAYYAYRSIASHRDRSLPYLERARRLAKRATARERLIIEATWADVTDDPRRLAIAETLTVQYPGEPASHYLLGNALLWNGDFAGALVAYRQAVAMDSVGLRDGATRCAACDAVEGIINAYAWADSLAAAERVARDWTARQPGSARAWYFLASVLQFEGDTSGAARALERSLALKNVPSAPLFSAALAIRAADFERAHRLLDDVIQTGSVSKRYEALWWLTISQRYEGRLAEALQSALAMRALAPEDLTSRLLHAQVLVESNRPRQAAALLDTVVQAMRTRPALSEATRARGVTWVLTQKAAALIAAGDTAPLPALAAKIRAVGARSGYGRDPRLYHYVQGMLLAARHRPNEAIAELRRAIFSPTQGYTRVNLELARLYLAQGQPHEAIPLLRAALHGPLEASNLYVTHTELHALLARAFTAAGLADSAAVHRRYVERARPDVGLHLAVTSRPAP